MELLIKKNFVVQSVKKMKTMKTTILLLALQVFLILMTSIFNEEGETLRKRPGRFWEWVTILKRGKKSKRKLMLLANYWENWKMLLGKRENILGKSKRKWKGKLKRRRKGDNSGGKRKKGKNRSEKKRRNKEKHTENGNRMTRMKIDSWNSGSSHLGNQINEIRAIIQRRKPHVLSVQESNFWNHHDKEKVKIDGYNLFFAKMLENKERNCSRIAVYVKEEIKAKQLKNLETDDFSAIWLELGLPFSRKIILGSVYREHSHLRTSPADSTNYSTRDEQEERWSKFVSKWEEALDTGREVLVAGDMNIDLLGDTQMSQLHSSLYSHLRLKILPRGVQQMIRGPTRYHSGSKPSLIDHVYSSSPEKVEVENVSYGSSDHNMIGIRRKNGAIIDKPRTVKKRVFGNFRNEDYHKKLAGTDWDEITNVGNVDEAANLFNSKLVQILDELCPIKLIQIRKNYTPWQSSEILLTESRLQLAREVAKRSGTADDQSRVHKIAGELRKKYLVAEEKWRMDQIRKNEKNPRMSWRQLKDWVGWTGGGSPKQLRASCGKIENSPKAVAGIMSKFYIDKVRRIREGFTGSGDPLIRLKTLMKNRTCQFKLRLVTEKEVLAEMRKMKNSTSLSPDGVQADLFKRTSKYALKAICHIVNLSIQTKRFAQMWKIAKVIPLWKGQGGEKLDPKEYRPVSLLSPLSRLVEKLVCVQILEYLESNGLLHPTIHGYRKEHGCATAILEAYEDAVFAQERGMLYALNMYDQSAAFDLVDHQILTDKMRIIGFDEDAIDWYKEFLKDRYQYVHVEGYDSEPERVVCGAPQGSSSGPLIWLLYTLELPELMSDEVGVVENVMGGGGETRMNQHTVDEASNAVTGGVATPSGGPQPDSPHQPALGRGEEGSGGTRVPGTGAGPLLSKSQPGPPPPGQGNQLRGEGHHQILRTNEGENVTQQLNVTENIRGKGKVTMFADDIMCGLMKKTKDELVIAMAESCRRLKDFCDSNKLKLNAGKTHYLILTSPQRHGSGLNISEVMLGGENVEGSKEERVLGVIVSNTLAGWRGHTDRVLKKCGEKLNALKLGGKLFSFKRRLETGKAVHLSRLFYCIEVWGPGLSKNQIQVLQACQNRLLSWVVGYDREKSLQRTTYNNIQQCGVLSVNQMIIFRVLLVGMKILRTRKPELVYEDLIPERGGRGVVGTRSQRRKLRPVRNSYFADRSWKNTFLTQHDRLPTEIAEQDVGEMKGRRELKEWVMKNVPLTAG